MAKLEKKMEEMQAQAQMQAQMQAQIQAQMQAQLAQILATMGGGPLRGIAEGAEPGNSAPQLSERGKKGKQSPRGKAPAGKALNKSK